LLLTYNREDVVNLEALMDAAFRMEQARLFPASPTEKRLRQAAQP